METLIDGSIMFAGIIVILAVVATVVEGITWMMTGSTIDRQLLIDKTVAEINKELGKDYFETREQ